MERKGPGQEKLYEKGEIDPIPEWIHRIVVKYEVYSQYMSFLPYIHIHISH